MNKLRRKLLKNTALGGIVASQLPETWVKPTIDTALLPAHATTSGCNVPCDRGINVEMSYDTYSFDLEMITAGGTRIAPKSEFGVMQGQCGLAHQGDFIGSNGVENITVSGPAMLTAGRYQLFVRSNEGNSDTMRVRVTACGQAEEGGIFVSNISADVTNVFALGSINLTSGGTTTIRLLGT